MVARENRFVDQVAPPGSCC